MSAIQTVIYDAEGREFASAPEHLAVAIRLVTQFLGAPAERSLDIRFVAPVGREHAAALRRSAYAIGHHRVSIAQELDHALAPDGLCECDFREDAARTYEVSITDSGKASIQRTGVEQALADRLRPTSLLAPDEVNEIFASSRWLKVLDAFAAFPLSRRELEVVERYLTDPDVDAIGRALGIRNNTVRNHLKAIYRKLGVSSGLELLSLALKVIA